MNARISRLLDADRGDALEELRRLSDENPAEFLELLGLLLDEADQARSSDGGEPAKVPTTVTFVITKQQGSDNQA